MSDVELVVAEDAEDAATRAAALLAEAARRGGHIAFSGGSTPRRAYALAAALEPDWSRVDAWLARRAVRPRRRRPREHPAAARDAPRPRRRAAAPPPRRDRARARRGGASLRPRAPGRRPRPRPPRHRLGRAHRLALPGGAVARGDERARRRHAGGPRAVGRAGDDDDPDARVRARGRLPRRRRGEGRGGAASLRRAADAGDALVSRPLGERTHDRDPRPRGGRRARR